MGNKTGHHWSTFAAARELAGSHLITSCAALAALFVFMPTGQHIVAAAFSGSFDTGIDRRSAIAVLLNVAVILFAWGRSKDLQRALASNELAQQAAHSNAFVDHVTGLANRRELMRVLARSEIPYGLGVSCFSSTSTSSRRSTTFMGTLSETKS